MSDADDIRNLEIEIPPSLPSPVGVKPQTPEQRKAIEKKAKNAGALLLIFGIFGFIIVAFVVMAVTTSSERNAKERTVDTRLRREDAARRIEAVFAKHLPQHRVEARASGDELIVDTNSGCDLALLETMLEVGVRDLARAAQFRQMRCAGKDAAVRAPF